MSKESTKQARTSDEEDVKSIKYYSKREQGLVRVTYKGKKATFYLYFSLL